MVVPEYANVTIISSEEITLVVASSVYVPPSSAIVASTEVKVTSGTASSSSIVTITCSSPSKIAPETLVISTITVSSGCSYITS